MNDEPIRIDGHAHVFHRGLPLAPGRRYAPDYDAPLEHYLRMLDDNGMTHGVLVQPSFLGTDDTHLVDCLKAAGGRLGGIAVVDDGVSSTELEALDRAGVSGIRWNLVGKPLPDLDAPSTTALIDRVKGLGWQIEIQRAAADLAPLARRLIDRGVTVVADHWGLPDRKLGVDDPGFHALLDVGRTGRARIKISGVYRNGSEGRRFARAAYPLVRDAFGLDRLIWGSDWPHTQFEATETYARNRALLDELVTDEVERARILAGPRALFRL
jgi:predicted TIM-barrel fold metal-dependent hydrolase